MGGATELTQLYRSTEYRVDKPQQTIEPGTALVKNIIHKLQYCVSTGWSNKARHLKRIFMFQAKTLRIHQGQLNILKWKYILYTLRSINWCETSDCL